MNMFYYLGAMFCDEVILNCVPLKLQSVTFDLLILELMFLFFKNTVKKSGIHFTNFVNLNKLSVSKQHHLC